MEEEFKNTKGDWKVMTHTSLNSAGKGVFITAVTVIVPIILWPIMADLKFQAEMGLLLAFIMFFDMLGALFFLPAAVNLFKPKFIYKHTHISLDGKVEGTADTVIGAVEMGSKAALKKLIAAGEDINAMSNGASMLMHAVGIIDQESRMAIIKLLLDAGADLKARDKNNNTALHLAASYGFDETAEMLINKGANANDGETIAGTPMGRALAAGHIKTIARLIDARATVDGDTVAYTLEHGGNGHPAAIEMILKLFRSKRVDFTLKDSSGKTIRECVQCLDGSEEKLKILDRLEI
jgi:hypothetical protein